MAALTQTAANVRVSSTASKARITAGAAITAGQTGYIDSAGLGQLGLNSALASVPTGIFSNNAASGQTVELVYNDPSFTHGLTGVVAGDTIWAHTTAGASTITLLDNAAASFTVALGVAISATKMVLNPVSSGVAHA